MITDELDLRAYNGEDSRIDGLVDDVRILKDSDEMMEAVLTILSDTPMPIPQVGAYYTFVYQPKTPRVRYDRNPLIACVEIYQWGFKGINYHWNDFRNYTWEELVTNPYLVYPSELEDLKSIPYQNYKINKS